MAYPHLIGDLKLPSNPVHRWRFNRLLKRLNRCAQLDKNIWRIDSGYRTYAEQVRLYKLYREGKGNLAAVPGTSNHEKGLAADVSVKGQPVGASDRRRASLKSHAMCLPVVGEKWHVEVGTTFRA